MCIIAIKPSNKEMFSADTIKTMFMNNPHGAGIMYLKPNGMVHIQKGYFNVNDMLSYIDKNINVLNNTDVVLHFRIATSGKKDALGCHPYPVWSNNQYTQSDVKLAMCHNGILDDKGWRGNDDVNDTQVFIKDCLRKLPHNFLRNTSIKTLIEKSIGTNKLCFLDEDGIHTIGDFIEDDGYLYSNTSYKPRTYFYSNNSSSFTPKSYTPKVFGYVDTKDEELDKLYKKGIKFDTPLSLTSYEELRKWVVKHCKYVSQNTAKTNAVFEDATFTYTLYYRTHKISRESKIKNNVDGLKFAQDLFNRIFGNSTSYSPQTYEEYEDMLDIAQRFLRPFEDETQYVEGNELEEESYYDDDYLYNFDHIFCQVTRYPLNDAMPLF